MNQSLWVVTRDGGLRFGPATHNDCFDWLHHAQHQSVDWAIRWEGWAIEPATAEQIADSQPVRGFPLTQREG